jgi:hypothetical protein
MTFTPVSNDPFEHYFYKRAQLADDLATSGFLEDARILSAASLDALAEIWLNDFPDEKRNLESELGGRVPSSIRLARFLKKFSPNDPRVRKVAVICFAEDWKHYIPRDASIADRLLIKRLSNESDEFLRAHEMPKSYLDVSRDDLLRECPELNTHPDLFALMEEYEYGALLYTFYRCPLVHFSTHSKRIHGFARGQEISYKYSYDEDNRITIGFGSDLITNWLRNAVSGYVQLCQQASIVPADNLDAGTSQELRFKKRWNRLI